MSKFQFNAEDYVHVITHMGDRVIGIYDGVRYVFEDGEPSEPVHWKVAHHIFGFRGTEQARVNALHRLGWLNRMDELTAMQMLKTRVEFHPMNPFPKGIVAFRKPEAAVDPTEPAADVTPTNEGTAVSAAQPVQPQAAPSDPFHESRGSRARKSGG
jgi:hypothetical protein